VIDPKSGKVVGERCKARLDEPGSLFQSPECESSGLPMKLN
jgi:hypothetical protein